MAAGSKKRELKNLGYEVFIGLLSILSIVDMFLVWLPGLSDESKQVIVIFQTAVTLIFVADFCYRLFTAGSKSQYFLRDWGWADLLACIPSLRILRFFRIFRVYRLLRDIGIQTIKDQLLYDRAGSILYLTIFLGMIIIQTASAWVLAVEATNPEANIQTPSDAIWWSYVTITTVGYGDRFPTTTTGRIVGVLLMTAGVALFGVFTSFLANTFLSPRKKPEEAQPVEGTAARLQELRQLLEEQEKTTTAIRERLEEIERLVVP
jgi:voltage-gated potassium channel